MSYLYDEDDDGDYSNSLNTYNQLNSYKYQNFSDDDEVERYVDPNLPKPPRLLLMGLRRSGKSSIQKVVFHKLAPNETLFLESTSKITKGNVTSFIDFQVWDFPGQVDFFDSTFDSEAIFGEVGTVVYVVDAQDDYVDSLGKLHDIIVRAHEVNKLMTFEVFVHKVDGLSDDYKVDLQRDIQQRIVDELADVGLESEVQLSFYLTSIYDHSIFEAFSKVVQKMIRQLPTLEHLLNALCANSGIEKAYLFDVTSKIYIATDTSPVDMYSYEICADMIDVVVDLANIYRTPSPPLTPQLDTLANGTNATEKEGSYSSIQLNSGLVLYFREINKYLALVCLLRNDTFEKRGLIDYNFLCFKKAILEVLKVRDNGLQLLQSESNQQ